MLVRNQSSLTEIFSQTAQQNPCFVGNYNFPTNKKKQNKTKKQSNKKVESVQGIILSKNILITQQ